ncbi:MAG: hypothetical protein ACJ8FL_04040 [Sphingomicrobium sp.]
MPGYRDNSNFQPFGTRQRKPTRMEWVLAVICIVMGGVLMASALAGDSAPVWLHKLRTLPIAVTELVLALMFWLRARANRPDESYSPRALRLTALFFVLLAALTAAVSLLDHSTGA